MNVEPRRRRWFRLAFSLRTLFVVVTGFAVWLGWNAQIVRERKAVLREIEAVSLPQDFAFTSLEAVEKIPVPVVLYQPTNKESGITYYKPPFMPGYVRVSYIRRLFGDESGIKVLVPNSLDAELAERLEKAFPEAQLLAIVKKNGSMPPKPFEVFAYRDSLYKPLNEQSKTTGTLFKGGRKDSATDPK